jgi:hypothetical protein
LIRYRRKTVDIDYDFQIRRSLAHDIGTISRFLLDVEYNIVRQYRDIPISKVKTFDVVQDIGAISGYTNIEVFPSISKIRSILGTICHTWGGRAHWPRSSPADGSSLLVLDPLGRSVLLRDCLDALSCVPTRRTPRNVQCRCPFGAEKRGLDLVGAALIAIAAHKLSEFSPLSETL